MIEQYLLIILRSINSEYHMIKRCVGVRARRGWGNKSVRGYGGCRGENRELLLNQWCRILLHKSLTRSRQLE